MLYAVTVCFIKRISVKSEEESVPPSVCAYISILTLTQTRICEGMYVNSFEQETDLRNHLETFNTTLVLMLFFLHELKFSFKRQHSTSLQLFVSSPKSKAARISGHSSSPPNVGAEILTAD